MDSVVTVSLDVTDPDDTGVDEIEEPVAEDEDEDDEGGGGGGGGGNEALSVVGRLSEE